MPTPSRYLTAPETAAGLTPRASLISAAVIRPSSSTRTAAKIRDGRRARPAEVRAPPSRSTKSAAARGSTSLQHLAISETTEASVALRSWTKRSSRSRGLVKNVRPDPGPGRARPHRRRGARCMASSVRTAPGKSTTIRVLLGLLRKDAGDVRLFGGDPWSEAAALHRRLAYVPGDVSLWPNLTGGEVIDLLGRLRGGLDEERRRGAAGALRARPHQEGPQPTRRATGRRSPWSRRSPRTSSCSSSTSRPPASTRSWSRSSRSTSSGSATAAARVLLSSHILAEVERLCDRVSIIRAGRGVETGHAGRAAPPAPARRSRAELAGP